MRVYQLAENHPALSQYCPFCENQFEAGDFVTLRPLRPADEDEAKKAADGRPYTAEALLMHEACARE